MLHFFGTRKASDFPLEVVKPNTWYKYADQGDRVYVHVSWKEEKNKESKKKGNHENPKGKDKK